MMRRLPWLSMSVAGLALLLRAWPQAPAHLAFEPGADASSQLWRILSCHLVHWSWSHALWDAMTFFALGAACEILDRRRFIACVLGSALLVPIAVALWRPDLSHYAGLSGLDVALFGLLMVLLLRRAWPTSGIGFRLLWGVMALGLPTKLIYEVATGSTFFVDNVDSGFVPVPLAHLVGAMVGIVVGLDAAGRTTPSRPRHRSPSGTVPHAGGTMAGWFMEITIECRIRNSDM